MRLGGFDKLEEFIEHQEERYKQSISGVFIDNLKHRFPKLTSTELKFCSLVRMKVRGKDLARYLNVSPRSIQIYRGRIRRKLGIDSAVDFDEFVASI